MCAAAESQDWTLPKSNIVSAKNIYWLETIFYSFEYDVKKINLYEYFQSKLFRIPTLEDEFFFKAIKSSPTLFTIQLHRVLMNPDKRPDDGCRLDILFTLLEIAEVPQLRTLHHGDDDVKVSYRIDAMITRNNKIWTMKCVFKLFEMTCLRNKLCETQNELIKHLARKSDKSGKNARELAFLLKRKSLDNVFSGRQKVKFSILKTYLIEQTLDVVSEIARKFYMKVKKMVYCASSELDVHLHIIQTGIVHCIRKTDSSLLYLDAHRYGLDFLKIECREFMMKNLDSEFIVDVLTVSNLVQDETLMNKALGVFLSNRNEIMRSDRWVTLLYNALTVTHSILDASTRKVASTRVQRRRIPESNNAQKS